MSFLRISASYSEWKTYSEARVFHGMAPLITPWVKIGVALLQDRHGIRARGLCQFVAARVAICYGENTQERLIITKVLNSFVSTKSVRSTMIVGKLVIST